MKKLSTGMQKPTRGDWSMLKGLARYLAGKPRCLVRYEYQVPWERITVVTDSDWAGDRVSRKSTSGGILFTGSHMIKSWCLGQKVTALSSGEAEYYSMVKGASTALGLQALLGHMGRRGLGK